jgi:parvulin-like peptidyl-prolyl isomerase
MEDLQRELRSDVLLDMLAEMSTKVVDADIGLYYQTHLDQFRQPERAHAWLIVLRDRNSAEAVRQAALEKGGDFAGLAHAVSEDPGTAPNGGDMGVFSRRDYAEEITRAAFALKPGQVSEVFPAPDGWCVVKLDQIYPPRTQPLSEVRAAIIGRIKREKRDAGRQEWLADEWQRARVFIPDRGLRAQVEAATARAREQVKAGQPTP